MERTVDIHKAAGILIRDRKFLVSRSKGRSFFISPGGKLKDDETPEEALVRELEEELTVRVAVETLEKFGTFYALATEQEDKYLKMDVFVVPEWEGDIQPSSEIEEIVWIDSTVSPDMKVGSIFQHDVLPRLKERGLID